MIWSPRWRSVKRTEMNLPDYSQYLEKPDMLKWIEEEWQRKPETHDFQAKLLNAFIKQNNIKSAVEIGCGTGEIAKRIIIDNYLGIDSNRECIELAREKNSVRTFQVADIRTTKVKKANLVFAFAFLKHFGLDEWNKIFIKLSSLGEYLIFDIPIAVVTKDDGTEYHHVWKSMSDIKTDIQSVGFELINIENADSIEPVFICKRIIF